ncbi:hypothetical protein [Haloarchaeobius amylolyticus]|uniref:hypothetical protein n=1 Tax=Haloarchaeobius amylolyticus TaxID=1198296 RepID=UPI00226DBEBD
MTDPGSDCQNDPTAPARTTETAVRESLLDTHGDLLAAVGDCADEVAAAWDGPATDRRQVVEPLTALLRQQGILERLPGVLASAVEAAGYDLRANPVPAPPYVVVTGTGPVLRATVADGRLVVRFECFELRREGGDGETPAGRTRYVRREGAAGDCLSVELKR